jgi:hypothetical protein
MQPRQQPSKDNTSFIIMKSQPNPNSSTTPGTNANTTGPTDFEIPTFQGAPERRTIDLLNLTQASINFLRDPFTRHSIVTPDGNRVRMMNFITTEHNDGADGQVSRVIVTRQTRVSTECDAMTILEDLIGVGNEGDNGDDLDQYLLMLLGDEEDGNAHPYRDEFEEQ